MLLEYIILCWITDSPELSTSISETKTTVSSNADFIKNTSDYGLMWNKKSVVFLVDFSLQAGL